LESSGQNIRYEYYVARIAIDAGIREMPHFVVALRRMRLEPCGSAALRFVGKVDHPNIVLAYDADKINGTHMLVMEYVDAANDLARLVENYGPLPVEKACEYIRQAALGLQHAHEQGLVHRDIKPNNLLVTADGKTIKLLDMGLARLEQLEDANQSTLLTQAGTGLGSADYIAPEQVLNAHTADIRADIYSLGCTLYFLLTAQVPFPGDSVPKKLLKHQREEPKPVERLRPDVPPGVVAVLRKMMAKKPDERYQTPAEVAAVLSSVLGMRIGTS